MYLESEHNSDFKGQRTFLQFWAIPSSFKSIPVNNSEEHYTIHELYQFKANLISTEPRAGKEKETPTIELTCSLENTL